MSADWGDDIAAWGALSKVIPGWEPSLAELGALESLPPEVIRALRRVSRGWSRDDARWDVLLGVLEYTRRTHAHELAEKIRSSRLEGCGSGVRCCSTMLDMAADLIDSEKESSDGR